MYQNIDRSSILDSSFHIMALETINYIINKNIETKAKISELEGLGSHLGERVANHLLNNNTTMSNVTKMEADEIMKFLGRDVWIFVFGRQISKLQTNRKGIFLIDAEEIKFHQFLIMDKSGNDQLEIILSFVSGIIKGVVAAFNLDCIVTAGFKVAPILNTILSNGGTPSNNQQGVLSYSFTINLSV